MSSGPGGSGTGGSAPSQKHSIQCKYCDEKPLVKNYPAHLSRKHPNKDQNDRTGKGGQSLLTFFPKRSRSSDDAVSKNKKRNCSGSGDSAIELEDRELEEDFGSTNLDADVSRRITDARSMKALEDEGFTYNTGLVICNICKESFKYDEDEGTDFTKVGDILPSKFRSLKRNVKIHLTRNKKYSSHQKFFRIDNRVIRIRV